MQNRCTWAWWLGLCMMCITLGYLGARGPFGGDASGIYDFRVIYAGAKAFRLGMNPYDQSQLDQILRQAYGTSVAVPVQTNTPLGFAALSPLTFGQLQVMRHVWLGLNIGMLLAIVRLMIGGLRLSWRDPRVPWLAAIIFGLAPLVTTFRVGQVAILVTMLIVLSWRLMARYPWLSGLLIALATAIKPTTAIALVFYPALRRRWSALTTALLGLTAIGVGAVLWLNTHSPGWFDLWQANLQGFGHGGSGDPRGPTGFQFINLQRPIGVLITHDRVVEIIVWLLVGIPALALAVKMWRERREHLVLLDFAVISTACMLVVYHRLYDALVVVLALGVAMKLLAHSRTWALLILGVVATYLVPIGAGLNEAARRGMIGEPWLNQPWVSATIWAINGWMGLILYWILAVLRLTPPQALAEAFEIGSGTSSPRPQAGTT